MCAVLAYYFVLFATPRAVLLTLKMRSNGELNQPVYNGVISDNDRLVALPNPDFLYIAMGYDVRKGDLAITGLFPDTSYYSIALYDTDTRNYFIMSDRDTEQEDYKILLTTDKSHKLGGHQTVLAESSRGFLLIRILITDPSRVEYLQEIQHSFKAEKLTFNETNGLPTIKKIP